MSIAWMRPLAMALDTTVPWARSGAENSPAYLASPVTLAGPSMRLWGLPTKVSRPVELKVATIWASLSDALVGDRLRRAGGGLFEAAHDGAPSELDLEAILGLWLGLAHDQVG